MLKSGVERFSMLVTLTDRSFRRKLSIWLVIPSIVGALIFTAGWLVAGRIQDHYNPRSDYISSLAAVDAANPWMVILAIVAFGIGVMSLGARLLYSLPDRLGRAGSLGVLLSGLGVVIIGSMRHDCGVQLPACSAKVSMGEISSYHAAHDVAGAATFVVAGLSQLLISHSVNRRDGWRYLRMPSAMSGCTTLVLFVLIGANVIPGWAGAIQRVLVVVACLWVSTVGVHMYRLDARGLGRGFPLPVAVPSLDLREAALMSARDAAGTARAAAVLAGEPARSPRRRR